MSPSRYAKLIVFVIGAIAAILTQVTPLLPGKYQLVALTVTEVLTGFLVYLIPNSPPTTPEG